MEPSDDNIMRYNCIYGWENLIFNNYPMSQNQVPIPTLNINKEKKNGESKSAVTEKAKT